MRGVGALVALTAVRQGRRGLPADGQHYWCARCFAKGGELTLVSSAAKTHIGHFTFWHASVVTNPRCMFLAEVRIAEARLTRAQDIFCTNYERGESKKMLDMSEHAAEFSADPLHTMIKHDASVICYAIPAGAMTADHRLKLNNPIDLFGDLPPNLQAHAGDSNAADVSIGNYVDDHGVEQNGKTLSSEMAARLFANNRLNHAVDYANCNTYESSSRLINTMCFHTMQVLLAPRSGSPPPAAEVPKSAQQEMGSDQPQHGTLWRGRLPQQRETH